MKLTTKLFLTLITASAFQAQALELMVVANTDMANTGVEKRQIRDIFMGNNSQMLLKPVALSPKSDARSVFNTKIVGLTESRIQSYWAQMRFSGRKKPPQEFESVEDMLRFMQSNKDTVGYLPADTKIPANFTVIFQTYQEVGSVCMTSCCRYYAWSVTLGSDVFCEIADKGIGFPKQ